MRRLCLVLMLLVLPLQMSWAAAHGYAHDVAEGHGTEAHAAFLHEDAGHAHETAQATADHGCCGTAHACHGSPHLAPTVSIGVDPADASGIGSFLRRLNPRDLLARIDRPRWAPA